MYLKELGAKDVQGDTMSAAEQRKTESRSICWRAARQGEQIAGEGN